MKCRVMIMLVTLVLPGLLAGVALADQTYMSVTFDDKPVDQPLGTGGTAVGEATSCDSQIEAIVRATPFDTRSLEIHNTDLEANRNIYFGLPDAPVSSGLAVVIADLWFYQTGLGWTPYIEFYDSGWSDLLGIYLMSDGTIRIIDSEIAATVPSYPTGRSLPILVAMDFDADTYSVWIDEVQWVADRPMTVSGSNFNIIQIGSGSDCAAENHFSIDQIRVVDTLPQIPTQRTSWGNVRALFRD
jgi:hypothetical protein